MHYYRFSIGDYRRDTSHLSRLEHSIYRDLIDWYYLDETPIPLETHSVMRRLRLVSDEEATALENVISDFFTRSDDGFRHAKIDFDIAEYHSKCNKNKGNGKKGGRPKSAKPLQDKEENPVGYESVTTGIPNESQNNPNHKPLTTNHKPVVKNNTPRAPRFDAQAHLVELGVDPAIAADWVRHRKSVKAEATATAIDGVAREADKAGMSLESALRECCVRGWRGFKADWMQQGQPGKVINSTVEQRNKAVAAAWVPPEMRGTA